jgi:hypothetical protein
MERSPASSVSVKATPAIEATSASTDATIATVCDWQVAPILQIRPARGAKRRRERNAFRHRDCTVIIHIYAVCVYKNTARPMLIRMVRASRCSHVIREHRASSAGKVMRGKSANVLHMAYVVHTERVRLAGSRWLASGKPPPVAYALCVTIVTIFIVRFDRDQRCFSLELPITMQACHAYPPHWEPGDDRGLNLRGTVEPRVLA